MAPLWPLNGPSMAPQGPLYGPSVVSAILKLNYSDFIVIKFTIFRIMAIFGPFIDYPTNKVMSQNLVSDIHKGFPKWPQRLVRFGSKMWPRQTIQENTYLVKCSKFSELHFTKYVFPRSLVTATPQIQNSPNFRITPGTPSRHPLPNLATLPWWKDSFWVTPKSP